MAGRVQDKVAIVIGAAQGIGAGIAERLIRDGAEVTIADWHEDPGAATAARLGAHFIKTDVGRKADVEALVSATLDRSGRVDILCQQCRDFSAHAWARSNIFPRASWDSTCFDLNIRSAYFLHDREACLESTCDQQQGCGRDHQHLLGCTASQRSA